MNKAIVRALNILERILTGAVAVMLAIVAVLICWQVFARYVLKTGVYWIEEFTVTVMMWIGLLGSAACVWTGSHMSLELVVKRLPRGARVWVEVIIDVIVGLFALFLCTQGWVLAKATMSSRMTSIPLSIGVSYMAIPVAGALMILFAAVKAAQKLAAFFGGEAADDAEEATHAGRGVRTSRAKRKRHA
jgi:TRAP-type C4-dicarboxylate transport system permease small subunit